MRRRLSLESLESRVTPSTLGTLVFDAQHLTVGYTAAPANTSTTQTPNTVALQPPAANTSTALVAAVGSLTSTNLTDTYSIASAVQGTTLTLALDGNGQMSLTVMDQAGHLLAQQSGQGAMSLSLTNLPATGGVTVVVTGSVPTGYLMSSLVAPSSTATTPPSTTTSSSYILSTTPPPTPPITANLTNSAVPILDPYGVGDPTVVDPNPIDVIKWEWTSIGNIQMYDPSGAPIFPWTPPPTATPTPAPTTSPTTSTTPTNSPTTSTTPTTSPTTSPTSSTTPTTSTTPTNSPTTSTTPTTATTTP